MKLYILVLVVLCSLSLAAPVMAAANLTANQISYTEMWVNGTGFTPDAEVTLSTSTIIPVTPSGSAYSYEMTGMYLPADSVLALDASPVKGDLNIHVKIKKYYLTLVRTYKYPANPTTGTVHVERSIPSLPIADGVLFQTIRVYGTTTNSSVNVVNLSVTVQRNVTVDESGAFSEKVDISAIPAGNYTISATDGTNIATNVTAIHAPGQLHHITITDPQTSELALNTTGNYTLGATGYDLGGKVVQNVAFDWWSSNTYIGTIILTGYFNATNVGHTEVYARSGAKESNHVIVYVNAPLDSKTLTNAENFTLESGNANVTGNFSVGVSGDVAVQAIGNVTAATTVGLGAGYEFTSGAIVNVSGEAHTELEGCNGTVTIKLCVSDSILNDMGLTRSSVQIYVYDNDSAKWIGLTTTRVGTTDCYTADISAYLSEATVGIGSKPAPTSSGGRGGDGTYPLGWGTPAPTAAPTSAPPPGVTPAPAKPKPAAAGTTPTAPAKETPTKKGIPGFTAVFAIAGMLAIAYVVMRRRR